MANWPVGGGATGARIRAFDWASTPLGSLETWPQGLRTAVHLLLHADLVTTLVWGPAGIVLFNDGLARLIGEEAAAAALGRPITAAFPDLADACGPPLGEARRGASLRLRDQPCPFVRGDALADRWFDALYSPVFEDAGDVAGVLCVLEETTTRVRAERERDAALAALRLREVRQAYLLGLADALRPLADPIDVKATALRVLGDHLRADRVVYTDVLPGEAEVDVAACYVREGFPKLTGRLSTATFGEASRRLKSGGTLVIADVDAHPDLDAVGRATIRSLGVRSTVGVPLVKQGRWVAHLGVHHGSPRNWTDEDIAIVAETAERTWADVERARAQAALGESERKYRTLFETMDEGFLVAEFVRDATGRRVDFRHLEVNAAMERHSAWPRSEVEGRLSTELVPGDTQTWVDAYAAMVDTPADRRERFVRYVAEADRWYEARAFPFGGGERFAVLFSDITRRRRMDLALQQREALQAFLLTLDEALRPVSAASAIEQAASSILGRHLGVATAGYAEIADDGDTAIVTGEYRSGRMARLQDRYRLSEYGEYGATILRGEELFVEDYAADTRGTRETVEAASRIGMRAAATVPLTRGGRAVAYLYAVHDEPRSWSDQDRTILRETVARTWAAVERARAEAALRESEELFRLLVDNVREYALFQTDGDGRVTSWNPGAERLFGYAGAEILNEPVSRLLSPEDRDAGLLDRARERLAQGTRHQDERWLVRRDGSRFWAQWMMEAVRDDAGLLRGFAWVLHDDTERKRAADRQVLLTAELNHRVRNTLATVQSIATQTLRRTPVPEEFVPRFRARVQALARAHALLTRRRWDSTEVTEILRDQLTLEGDADRIALVGPAASLGPSSALAVALVLHELGTNARKYGALSMPAGRLSVSWCVEAAEAGSLLLLEWRERGGPAVSPPSRRGFGTTLVERSLQGVGGTAQLRFDPDGVACDIRLPLAGREEAGAANGARVS